MAEVRLKSGSDESRLDEPGLEQVPGTWERFLSPAAITVVGASPSVPSSLGLLNNLKRPEARFKGAVYAVNPRRTEVAGVECFPSLGDIPGTPGVVFLFVPAQVCLDVLETLPRDVEGVVVFSGGFAEVGNVTGEEALAAWSSSREVPLLGPQSLGFVSMRDSVVATTGPIPEQFASGRIAVVMQSGGLFDGTLRSLMQSGMGISLAFSCGGAAALSFAELGTVCLRDPDTDALAVYVEAVRSLDELAELGRAAARAGKPVILLFGGASALGLRATESHTGARATPLKLTKAVADQYGMLVVDDQSELIWTLDALVASEFSQPEPGGVAIYSHSAGAAIALADAADRVGLPLAHLSPATATELGVPAEAANPLDAGAPALFDPELVAAQVRTVAADPAVAIVARTAGIGLPEENLPGHMQSAEAFVKEVQAAGKVPVMCAAILQDTEAVPRWPGVVIAAGAREAAVKLRALRDWANHGPDEEACCVDRIGPADAFPAPEHESGAVVTGLAAREFLSLGSLGWPRQELANSAAEALVAARRIGFPVVLKAECGLAHRAEAGGIVQHIRDESVLSAAVDYLISSIGPPVSVNAEMPHEREFTLGVERVSPRDLIVALGMCQQASTPDPDFMVFPITRRQFARIAARYEMGANDRLWETIQHVRALFARDPRIQTIEFNPFIVIESTGELIALDAKVHFHGAETGHRVGVA